MLNVGHENRSVLYKYLLNESYSNIISGYFEILCFFLNNTKPDGRRHPLGRTVERKGEVCEGYVSLGKLAEMSNSRTLASNQRPNKTTPSRRACASPLSSLLYIPLASKFFVTFSSLAFSPFPSRSQPLFFPQDSLASSTLTINAVNG